MVCIVPFVNIQEKSKQKISNSGCILFVVQETERNVVDQRELQNYLYEKYHVFVYRKSLLQVLPGSIIG